MENLTTGCLDAIPARMYVPGTGFQKVQKKLHLLLSVKVLNFSLHDWEELTEESFKSIFKDSPIRRSKFYGIKRNLKFLSAMNSVDQKFQPTLN
jgi:epoxyqueuosine reductase QueG